METIETPPDRDALLTSRALQCTATELGTNISDLQITSVSGGFSRNRRALVSAGDKTIFVKEVDIDVLPGEGERELAWLKKDYEVTRLLQKLHPKFVADWIKLDGDGHVLINQLCVDRRLVVAAASGKIPGRTIHFSGGSGNSRVGKNGVTARDG